MLYLYAHASFILLQMRKLRSENLEMKKQRDDTRKMVEDVKEQMKVYLQAAVDKAQNLQKQLDTVTAEKEALERELAAIRKGERGV